MKQITARLEHLQKAYPPIPAEISELIQREVAIQEKAGSLIKDGKPGRQSARFSWKKAVILALVATMILGTTALANGALGRLRIQKAGKYALNIGVIPAEDTSGIPAQIPLLSLKAGYIPEGYCAGEASQEWDVYPEGKPDQNGITTGIFAMGVEITEEGFPLTIDYVMDSEEISWQDRTALYVEIRQPYGTAPMKRLYIPLPEYWQGLIVYAGENISKDELIKYAENLEVIREEGTCESAGKLGWVEHPAEAEASLDYGTYKAPADRVRKNLHSVGETFPLLNTVRKVSSGAELAVCVKKVEVFDDFSPLDNRYLDETIMELLDEEQKLKPSRIRYMAKGDGISSLVAEITSRTVVRKLVYVTVEYTNVSDRDLQNIEDTACFCLMIEKGDSFVIYDRAMEDGDSRTDYIVENENFHRGRLIYSDASMGGSLWECRVIPELKAGETVTVHIAGVVNEDELDKLYLNFADGENKISERTLAGGYVDLRQ